MQPEQQQRIMGYFIEEAKDHLNTIEQGLVDLPSTLQDSEMVNEVFRAAHSVKGGAAMLGLNSIQKTAHRLEDCFKVLKECPVKVDRKLESLFLKVSDTLKELLEQLSGPFGLTDETSSEIMSGVEPVFDDLNQHLRLLVDKAGGVAVELQSSNGSEQATSFATTTAPKVTDGAFQTGVMTQLRDMLQLFRQPDQPQCRQKLQEICFQLEDMGEQFELPTWSRLIRSARGAIANPKNQERTLAPILIKEIKQAQELVLAGRATEIVPSQQLTSLLKPGQTVSSLSRREPNPAVDVEQPSPSSAETRNHAEQTAPVITVTASTAVNNTKPKASNRFLNNSGTFLQAESEKNDFSDDQFTYTDSPTTVVSEPFSLQKGGSGDSAGMPTPAEPHGPEVGMAELNSLADLFEGESPDLDQTWQEEEIISNGASDSLTDPFTSLDSADADDAESDFSDLLYTTSSETYKQAAHQSDDLSSLFGDGFPEESTQADLGLPTFDFSWEDTDTEVDTFQANQPVNSPNFPVSSPNSGNETMNDHPIASSLSFESSAATGGYSDEDWADFATDGEAALTEIAPDEDFADLLFESESSSPQSGSATASADVDQWWDEEVELDENSAVSNLGNDAGDSLDGDIWSDQLSGDDLLGMPLLEDEANTLNFQEEETSAEQSQSFSFELDDMDNFFDETPALNEPEQSPIAAEAAWDLSWDEEDSTETKEFSSQTEFSLDNVTLDDDTNLFGGINAEENGTIDDFGFASDFGATSEVFPERVASEPDWSNFLETPEATSAEENLLDDLVFEDVSIEGRQESASNNWFDEMSPELGVFDSLTLEESSTTETDPLALLDFEPESSASSNNAQGSVDLDFSWPGDANELDTETADSDALFTEEPEEFTLPVEDSWDFSTSFDENQVEDPQLFDLESVEAVAGSSVPETLSQTSADEFDLLGLEDSTQPSSLSIEDESAEGWDAWSDETPSEVSEFESVGSADLSQEDVFDLDSADLSEEDVFDLGSADLSEDMFGLDSVVTEEAESSGDELFGLDSADLSEEDVFGLNSSATSADLSEDVFGLDSVVTKETESSGDELFDLGSADLSEDVFGLNSSVVSADLSQEDVFDLDLADLSEEDVFDLDSADLSEDVFSLNSSVTSSNLSEEDGFDLDSGVTEAENLEALDDLFGFNSAVAEELVTTNAQDLELTLDGYSAEEELPNLDNLDNFFEEESETAEAWNIDSSPSLDLNNLDFAPSDLSDLGTSDDLSAFDTFSEELLAQAFDTQSSSGFSADLFEAESDTTLEPLLEFEVPLEPSENLEALFEIEGAESLDALDLPEEDLFGSESAFTDWEQEVASLPTAEVEAEIPLDSAENLESLFDAETPESTEALDLPEEDLFASEIALTDWEQEVASSPTAEWETEMPIDTAENLEALFDAPTESSEALTLSEADLFGSESTFTDWEQETTVPTAAWETELSLDSADNLEDLWGDESPETLSLSEADLFGSESAFTDWEQEASVPTAAWETELPLDSAENLEALWSNDGADETDSLDFSENLFSNEAPGEGLELAASELAAVEALLDLDTEEEEPETVETADWLDNSESLTDEWAFMDAAPASVDEMADFGDELSSLETAAEDSMSYDLGGFDEFADLEAMLGDETANSAAFTSAEFDDFSELEALLGEAPSAEREEPRVDPSRLTTPSIEDDEFSDLEVMLGQAEQQMGGSATTKSNVRPALPAGGSRQRSRVFEQTMRVPVKHLDILSNLVGELVVNRNTLEQDQERLRQFLDNLLHQVQQLSDAGARMQDRYERSLLESALLSSRQEKRFVSPSRGETSHSREETSSGSGHDPNSTSARLGLGDLEIDRGFTPFHTLAQEIIELIVRVRESASDIEFIVEETDQVARMLRQVTTQLQEGLTRARMVPFAQTADRLPRAVREISLKCGKQAELHIEGRETLLDKVILEHLSDPMTHLVNNAITHGIEPPDVRQGAGKPPIGRITIRAFHQGNQTVISVSDDGAGIDPERVKGKAIQKGLITQADARTMTRLDVYDLLFHPGFSTTDQVSDFAGRGVGMDVVRTSLTEIRGVINIDSTVGKGTTFTIRLPLTLSICKALCCLSDKTRLAFPMDGVEDMLDISKERVQTNSEGQTCIAWRDSLMPFQHLSELLTYNRHLSRGTVYGGNREDDMISIVVLRSAGNFIAVEVDQVLGEQEIVIKQLEGPVPKPVGVAGATVLGDGRIMPIADVLELIDLSRGVIRKDSGGSLWEKTGIQIPVEPPVTKTEPMVLIVDDSITVRELLSMTFNKAGYRVEQARDGQEAWEKLRSGLPCDIVFCDIEMPRMDGLELLSRLEKDPNLNQMPVAMLTSRGADRHRQMAAQLGASGYFTKPYLEEALLDAAQRMMKGEKLV